MPPRKVIAKTEGGEEVSLTEAKKAELLALWDEAAKNNKTLQRKDIVAFATRHPNSALHSHFTWDNKKAGEKYRLIEAGRLIRAVVHILPQHKVTVRGFVSLKSDRSKPGGGYRSIDSVLGQKEMRDYLVFQAYQEMQVFIAKYKHLEELASVISAMEKTIPQQTAAAS